MPLTGKWGALGLLGKIINPIIMAAVSAGFGYYFDEINLWNTEKAEILQKTAHYLSSEHEEVRYLTTIFLTGFEDKKEMARKFIGYVENKEKSLNTMSHSHPRETAQNDSDRVSETMAELDDSLRELKSKKIITVIHEPSDKDKHIGSEPENHAAVKEKTGWIFLGRYDTKVDCWNTKQFDFLDYQSPDQLLEKTIKAVDEKGYIWNRPPSPFGAKGKLLGTFKQGSEFTVVKYEDWASAGYIWAKVAYKIKSEEK